VFGGQDHKGAAMPDRLHRDLDPAVALDAVKRFLDPPMGTGCRRASDWSRDVKSFARRTQIRTLGKPTAPVKMRVGHRLPRSPQICPERGNSDPLQLLVPKVLGPIPSGGTSSRC